MRTPEMCEKNNLDYFNHPTNDFRLGYMSETGN